MATQLTTKAPEQGTYVIHAAFSDEDGAPVTPNTASWTLTDPAGTVVNNRSAVAISPPAAEVDVVLQGADLALEGYATLRRHFALQGTYDSTLGSDLPLVAESIFEIEPVVAVKT